MRFYQIAPNLYIADNVSFGEYTRSIVHKLLITIERNFSSVLGIPPFSSCNCFIEYTDHVPMCCKIGDAHWIFLNTSENYWNQWIYQFSHEYCHHLINGELSGAIVGLTWFEESICELSSMFHLYQISLQWSNSPNSLQSRFVPSLQHYLNNLFLQHPQLVFDTHHPGFLSRWEQILSEPVYHRDYYNAIAVRMFPLFVECPALWKIILHFGDMRQWKSLSYLFEYLRSQADETYYHSFEKLYNLLNS